MADLTLSQTLVYIFCLMVVLAMAYLSSRLYSNNNMSKDKLNSVELYEKKKQSQVTFYLAMLKEKFWILGVFGIYLFTFLFLGLLSQLTSSSSLLELTNILQNIVLVLGWGVIPFTLFWIGYIVYTSYTKLLDVMRHQYGSITGRSK